MFGGRVIETERDERGTRQTEVLEAQSANIELDMGNGMHIEIPLRPQIIVTTVIDNGRAWPDPTGAWHTRAPDRMHLHRVEVQPLGEPEMFRLFQEAQEPEDSFCDCGLH